MLNRDNIPFVILFLICAVGLSWAISTEGMPVGFQWVQAVWAFLVMCLSAYISWDLRDK